MLRWGLAANSSSWVIIIIIVVIIVVVGSVLFLWRYAPVRRTGIFSKLWKIEIITLRLLVVNILTPSKRACRPVRYFAITNHISTLKTSTRHILFIRLVGPPLPRFDPTRYIDSWLLRGGHSAIDTNSKERSQEFVSDENVVKFWSLLLIDSHQWTNGNKFSILFSLLTGFFKAKENKIHFVSKLRISLS